MKKIKQIATMADNKAVSVFEDNEIKQLLNEAFEHQCKIIKLEMRNLFIKTFDNGK